MNQFRLMGVFRAGDAHGMIGCIVAALVTLAFLAPLSSMAAEEKSMQDLSLEIEAAAKKVRNGHSKVSHLLEKEISKIRARQSKIPPHSAVAPVDLSALSTPLVKINAQGHVQVYIYVRKWGSAERAALEKLGVTIEIANTDFGIIQARVPHGRIKKIARLDFVSRITPPAYGELQAGSVQTEGDAILGGDDVRALGFDGSGVNIGVISFGVVGLATAQSSGDLPFVTVLQTAIDDAEGTAMLEIVHDIAPGATLGFCGLPTRTSLEFIQCVNMLNTTFNADIIVDDIGFFDEPYFEDGIVAQTVKSAVDAGIFYTSAAGNSAERHYQDDFLADGSGSGFHDFGTRSGGVADIDADFIIPPGETLALALQWSEPFGGACSDYNLVLYDQFLNILDISLRPQSCGEDPIESVWYTNPSIFTSVPASIGIVKDSGNDATLEMFYTLEPEEYNMPEDSVFGHSAVRGVMAAGAIAYSDPGNDDINTYSSRGPATILIPASDIRDKPDISAIDGVSVTGAGGFPTNFSGTSASAPHVAAIAALLMSADPSATATGISDAIKNSAVDLGSAGPDFTYGFGRIDALAALYELVGCIGNDTDTDGDGIDDNCDNCIDVANAGQQDTDGDGHGNICDADLDQSCFTNFNDLAILKSVFFSADADADLDSSGFVNFNDLALFKGLFFQQPGPSASGSLCDS